MDLARSHAMEQKMSTRSARSTRCLATTTRTRTATTAFAQRLQVPRLRTRLGAYNHTITSVNELLLSAVSTRAATTSAATRRGLTDRTACSRRSCFSLFGSDSESDEEDVKPKARAPPPAKRSKPSSSSASQRSRPSKSHAKKPEPKRGSGACLVYRSVAASATLTDRRALRCAR